MKSTGYNSINSWGVAVACSFVQCMSLFPIRVAGMLFVAFLSRYDTDRQNAAYFVVISGVLSGFISPLSGYLGAVYELRNLVTMGCLLTSLGVGICYFADSIVGVTLSLGFIYGTGVIFQYYLLPQIVKKHFTENIASANGVINTGSCVGSFVVIPLFKVLLDNYGVAGALLISSGIMLNAVPVAMLLRDPKYKQLPLAVENKEATANEECVSKETDNQESGFCNNSSNTKHILVTNSIANDNEINVFERSYVTSNVLEEKEGSYTSQNMINNKKSTEVNMHPIKNIPFQLSLTNTKEVIVAAQKNENNYNNATEQLFYENTPSTEKRNKFRKALNTLLILKNPSFLAIMFCQSINTYIVVFISTIIVDISRDKGINQEQEQIFLMLLPLTQIVGFTCFGWVTDKGYMTPANFLAIVFLCMGFSFCGFVFLNSFVTMMIAVIFFGLCISVITGVGPSLVYQFVDEKKQTMAISSRRVLVAPLFFTMGPMNNYFRGTLGSYNGVLYILSATCVGCSAILTFLPCIARFTNRKK